MSEYTHPMTKYSTVPIARSSRADSVMTTEPAGFHRERGGERRWA